MEDIETKFGSKRQQSTETETIHKRTFMADSIAYRLAKKANTEIKEIEVVRSKKRIV